MTTAYTSFAAGDALAAANWTPNGVPGNGDTVTIGHAMTLAAAATWSLGKGGAAATALRVTNTGSLVVGAGAVVTLAGNLVVDGHASNDAVWLDLQGGGVQFDAPAGQTYLFVIGSDYYRYAKVRTRTAGGVAPFVRKKAGSAGLATIQSPVSATASWCVSAWDAQDALFTDLGGPSLDAWTGSSHYPGGSTTGSVMTRCTWTNCGRVDVNNYDGVFQMTSVRFLSPADAAKKTLELSVNTAQAGNVALQKCDFAGNVLYTGDFSLATKADNVYRSTVTAVAYTGPATPAVNFYYQTPATAVPGQYGNLTGVQTGYLLADYTADPTAADPSYFQNNAAGNLTIDGCVFDYIGNWVFDTGDGIDTGGAAVVTFSNNLVLKATPLNGDTVACSPCQLWMFSSSTGTLNVVNNTVYCAVGRNSGVQTGHDPAAGVAGIVPKIRNNLFFTDDTSAPVSWLHNDQPYGAGAAPQTQDLVTPGGVLKNAAYGFGGAAFGPFADNTVGGVAGQSLAGISGLKFTAAPAAAIAADPQFVDRGRNFLRWCREVRGHNSGAQAADKDAGLADVAADPTLVRLSLLPWVKAGYAPQAAAYRGAGVGGADVGAVPAAAPASALVLAPPTGLPAFLGHLTDPLTGAGGFQTYTLANFGPAPFLNGPEHYDPPRCFYEARDYQVRQGGAVSDWSAAILCGLTRLRDGYYLPAAGQALAYHSYAQGLARDYYETGGLDSRDCVLTLDPARGANFGIYGVYGTVDQGGSRENAFTLLDLIEAEWMGRGHSTFTEEYAAVSLGHIDQWTRPAGQRYWATWTRPFMVALTCEALIAYWERYRHNPDAAYVTTFGGLTQAQIVAAIPGKVQAAADWLWANCWMAAGTPQPVENQGNPNPGTWPNGAFRYTDVSTFGTRFAPVTGQVVPAAGTANAFRGPAGLAAPYDDYYKYAYVTFTSGANAGQNVRVGGFTAATRTFVPDTPYLGRLNPPQAGDVFEIESGAGGLNAGPMGSGDAGCAPDLNHLVAPLYAWLYWHRTRVAGVDGSAYRAYYDSAFNGGTMCWSPPTKQKQWNQAVRWGFTGLDWEARGDAEWAAATTHALTPTSTTGPANLPSDRIKVTLADRRSVANPVGVTFASSSGRGSFVPATATLTNFRPYAFTRFVPDPADAGTTVTVTAANDGGLTPPAGFGYAVTAAVPVATGYAVTGQATGPARAPASYTLATVPPGAAVPVAALRAGGGIVAASPFDGYRGGSFQVAAYPGPAGGDPGVAKLVWVSPERPSQAFTYKVPTAGVTPLTFQNPAGAAVAGPLSVTFTAPVLTATGYSLTPPGSSVGPAGLASGAFTVSLTPAGAGLAAPATVRPGDGGAGGVFSPPAVTLSAASPSATFTYTPAKAAAVTVACDSGGALTDPPPLTYTSVTPAGAGRPARFLPRRGASR